MEAVKYIGLVMLVVGVLLTLLMAIFDDLGIDKYEVYINIMWPVGLLLYALMDLRIKKQKQVSK